MAVIIKIKKIVAVLKLVSDISGYSACVLVQAV